MNYYSNFIEVDHLRVTTSEQVIENCKSHFACHRIPDLLITDNGPQFSSKTFSEFSADYQFQHYTSSPHYPRSKGKAEKVVQTVKNLLCKAQADKRNFHLALPTNDSTGSPAQHLMGRRTKNLLPTAETFHLQLSSPATRISNRTI